MTPSELKTDLPWLKDRIIFMTRAGSEAYGTNTPDSDQDVRGLAIPPLSYIFGLSHFDQVLTKVPDCVIFSLQKFIRLALQCNPNCIELLFTDPSDHLLVTDIGKKLLANRDLFLSQRAFGTFAGYAKAQLRKLLVDGPDASSSPARLQRIATWGYDTKHAMHLVRLLRMGTEIMQGKGVIVKRPDAEELLAIRNGAWTLDTVVEYSEAHSIDLKDAALQSKLPPEPEVGKVNELLIQMLMSSFGYKVKMPVMKTGPFESCEWTFASGEVITKKLTNDEEPEPPKKALEVAP